MEHLLNDAPDDADEVATSTSTSTSSSPHPPLPHLATQLAHVASPSSSAAASLGLHMLSVSAAAPPRLPPISLLTAAAAALQPMPMPAPQLRPVMLTPLQAAQPTAPASSRPPPADDMLCRYRNKKCGYPRAIKRNGERHNLCERHRAKANQNQRKLESKRRTRKRLQQRQHGADRLVKVKKAETEVKFTHYV